MFVVGCGWWRREQQVQGVVSGGWFVTAFSISVAARPERGEHRCATVKTDCAEIKKGKNTHGVMSGPFGVKMLLINLQMS